MSDLYNKIDGDVKAAMKAQEKERLGALRLVLSALKNKRIDKRADLTDDDVIATLITLTKQRKESIEQFTKGNRPDLVAKEEAELKIIEAYLPEQMSEEDVRKVVVDAIAQSGAASQKEIGKVMGILMPKLKGKADGKLINTLVRELLPA